ncbi:hypothetical protein [Candidatus Cryosericum terrychapinii]|uniref:Uncharacterized protein n=1 Tax=Candidatus Cryosericum terrychapinii TaxID=2290919 RepID=A0A398CT39_9BACT|nr:hypothetical protein [Candidatus Cryosericum terrychapinii]RIE05732.1 hypothetical protein SMC7_06145 [Candidatus Cryosericum terrychapinii]
MNKRMLWSRILCVIGLAMMPIDIVTFVGLGMWGGGKLPPVEVAPNQSLLESLISIIFYVSILAGSGLAALGALLGKSHHRKLLYGALGLTVCGLTTVFLALNFYVDAAPWWVFVALTYPIGLIMSLVGAVLVIVESFRRPPVPKENVEAT